MAGGGLAAKSSQSIGRENGARGLAPTREALALVHSLGDDGSNSARLITGEVDIVSGEFGPPTIEDLIDANS